VFIMRRHYFRCNQSPRYKLYDRFPTGLKQRPHRTQMLTLRHLRHFVITTCRS
jgi:hypothetical protein